MPIYSATTASPYEYLERATAGLRGQLRLQVVDDGDDWLPDRATLTVTGPVTSTDGLGGTWYEYVATIESASSPRATS